jgi:hypothetical protein
MIQRIVIARSEATKQSRSRCTWPLDCFVSLAITKLTLLRSRSAVDRNGSKKFRTNHRVKGLRPPKAALRALDTVICSETTLAIAIDGFL